MATRAGGFRVHAPLIELSKAEIVKLGLSLGVDYAITHSCYDPAPASAACGRCDACALRRKASPKRACRIRRATQYAGGYDDRVGSQARRRSARGRA